MNIKHEQGSAEVFRRQKFQKKNFYTRYTIRTVRTVREKNSGII